MSSRFERTASKVAYGGGFIEVRKETFRHEDGKEVERELVHHTGAVGVVVLDGDRLWLVRQPREAIGIPDLLEIPAGKLDVEGEPPVETAKRELAEEVGKRAAHWEPLGSFYTSAGFTDEEIHLFLATGISDAEQPDVEEDERIDIETRHVSEVDDIIASTQDAKTLIALLGLRDRLRAVADEVASRAPARQAEAAVERLSHEWMRAWLERDEATLERLLAPGFTLRSIATDALVDRASWLREALSGRVTGSDLRFDDLRVTVTGDTAVVDALTTFTGAIDDEDWSSTTYLTDVWVRHDGRWRVLRRHSSRPAGHGGAMTP